MSGELRKGITMRFASGRKPVEPIDLDDTNPDAFSAPAIPTRFEPQSTDEIRGDERAARQAEREKNN